MWLVIGLQVLPCLAGSQVHPWTCPVRRPRLHFKVFALADLVAADGPPERELGR